jgi:hypothetical protein
MLFLNHTEVDIEDTTRGQIEMSMVEKKPEAANANGNSSDPQLVGHSMKQEAYLLDEK